MLIRSPSHLSTSGRRGAFSRILGFSFPPIFCVTSVLDTSKTKGNGCKTARNESANAQIPLTQKVKGVDKYNLTKIGQTSEVVALEYCSFSFAVKDFAAEYARLYICLRVYLDGKYLAGSFEIFRPQKRNLVRMNGGGNCSRSELVFAPNVT